MHKSIPLILCALLAVHAYERLIGGDQIDQPAKTYIPEKQWFLAGGCLGTLVRERNIPGRTFLDFDRKTPKDPAVAMDEAGFNAFRVESSYGDCLGPTVYDNTDVLNRERNFEIFGGNCADTQVEIAKELVAKGWKYVHTINFPEDIPAAWVNYTYVQMLAAIDGGVKSQLKPFLDQKLRPDIVLFQNEGESGFLFTGRDADKSDCGKVPTGLFEASWPQLAGYHKQQILSVREAVTAAGLDPAYTRFGLHNHVQYTQWKTPLVWGPDRWSEQKQGSCNFTGIIPPHILNWNLTDDLDIIGFSAYADSAVNTSAAEFARVFADTNSRLNQLDSIIPLWGKWKSGPFAGQWKKQALGIEYASYYNSETQSDLSVAHTKELFRICKSRDYHLGNLWWEPTYNFNNWLGGYGSLYSGYYNGSITYAWPVPELKAWGAEAVGHRDGAQTTERTHSTHTSPLTHTSSGRNQGTTKNTAPKKSTSTAVRPVPPTIRPVPPTIRPVPPTKGKTGPFPTARPTLPFPTDLLPTDLDPFNSSASLLPLLLVTFFIAVLF